MASATSHHRIRDLLVVLLVLTTLAVASGVAPAAETPRRGGVLLAAIAADAPSLDPHQEQTFATIELVAPLYSTLLQIDPYNYPKIIGDLATEWKIAPDGLVYTFKIRPGVKFHDGSPLTAADVKASYDKIIFPPAGIISARKGTYQAVEVVEAPDPATVRFRLKWPEASFLVNLASPYSWIYKADILAKDIRWYETNVMGTGPFKFVEHVKGSHWVGKKNPDYWDKGKPYLDGYRALFMSASSAQVAAIRAERAHIQFRTVSPADRDGLVQAMGSKVTIQESPWACVALVAMNHERKPFDDKRVRRALTLALDRYEASRNLSRIAVVKEVAGI
jgi:peptide/nickel transport system substrate-binding protein